MTTGPSKPEIDAARALLRGQIIETPTLKLAQSGWAGILPKADVTVKLELFQQAGSFKARGVWLGINGMSAAQKAAGVVAASGGNHALAVSWAAAAAGISAKIAMPKATDLLRVQGCRALGADVVLCDDIAAAFAVMDHSAQSEGRTIMHPFDAPHMILGAATCGAEYLAAHPDIDLFIIPVGGGGLIAGMAAAIRQHKPDATIIGVEPYGADSLWQSLRAGTAQRIASVDTIADSLGSPTALPYSFGVAQANVDDVVRVTDDALRAGMRHYRDILRLVAEPACAASLAALTGPLAEQAHGKRVGIIACGSNISPERFTLLAG